MPTLNVVNGNDSADVGMYCKELNQDKLYFKHNFLVKSLLAHLIHAKSITINNIKRHISRYFAHSGIYSHLHPLPYKPHALHVHEMFDPLLTPMNAVIKNSDKNRARTVAAFQ